MLGIRLSYYSTNVEICSAIEEVIDLVEMEMDHFLSFLRPLAVGRLPDEQETNKWFTDIWDMIIPELESRLVKHGNTFLAGTMRPTIADFKAF